MLVDLGLAVLGWEFPGGLEEDLVEGGAYGGRHLCGLYSGMPTSKWDLSVLGMEVYLQPT